ncbi:MAG: response regulator [Deltaproteobacteria bacterium]|nr:response regulator [Deltaproteobacteria bacterium]
MRDHDLANNKVEILIVEDSPTQAEELKYTLERHDLAVSIAANGVEALSLIRERKPTMVISDIVMPEMDGYQLCRAIKNDEEFRALPVILLTALSDPRDVVRGLECGADNFITKPYDDNKILSRIQYILANKHLKDIENTQLGVEVILACEKYFIKSDRIQILNLLLSSYEAAIQKNDELIKAQYELMLFNERLEQTVESRTAELRESEGRYRLLLESVTDYVYTTLLEDGGPITTSHGSGCVAVTGYTSEEYAADPGLWLRMVHEADRPIVLEQANSVLAGKTPFTIEHRIIHKDGRICWIRNTPVPRYNQEGSLVACDGIVTDITEHKRSEEEIRKGKAEWERTFDAIIDPIMIVDIGYKVVRANRAMADKLGVTPDETIGLICYTIIHGVNEPPPYCPYAQLLADGFPHLAEINEPRLGGHFFVSGSPLYDCDGKLYGCVCNYRDITERKTLERQLFQSQKMEAIGQLAGGVAHDFNNIITAIVGFSTLIEMGMDKDDPQRENINHVLASADRAADLTRSLLAFSRKQIINPQPVDLNQIIGKTEKFLKRIIGEDVDLKTSITQDVLAVNADSGQIEQVLMNLAANARDAMPKGGLLLLETGMVEMDDEYVRAHGYGDPGCYALISFSDTGEGMDEIICKRVFEPFFTTKEVGKGTGLGLSIVYGIVKQHNGFINVYSEPGKGTTFKIYLPLIQPAFAEKHTGNEGVLKGGTETILLADDDASLRELAEKFLGMFGYTIITAVDGSDALARFSEKKDRIHLVILDIIMPKINGKEAFDEMRKINPDIKAIFISGYTNDIIHKRGMLDQGLDFVSKPLDPKKLLFKVREVLGGKTS